MQSIAKNHADHKPRLRLSALAIAQLFATCAAAQGAASGPAPDSLIVAAMPLQEVVVQASRSSVPNIPAHLPAVSEGISHQQMAMSINVINTEDALKYLPSIQIRKRFIGDTNGIVASRSSGTLVSARALVYADNLLLANLLGNSYSYPPRWGMVTPDEIERIDVIYGPFSALYPGNAMGAVILMTTRMPSKFEAHVSAHAFSQDYHLYGTDERFSGKQAGAALGNKSGDFSWWFNVNRLDNSGQPMSFLNKPISTVNALAGDKIVTGAQSDIDPSGKPRVILGATSMTETVQDHAKVKLAYDFSPTMRAAYTLGLWQAKTDSNVASYLKDAAGNTVYSGNVDSEDHKQYVNIGGKRYELASTDLNPGKSEQEHWMHGLSLATHTKGEWDWEAAASVYDYRKDLARAPTVALPEAVNGGSGSITDMSGTGWTTLDLRGIWRPGLAAGAHQVSFGYHYDKYKLNALVSKTSNWLGGDAGARTSAFTGNTETQALYAQDAWRLADDWKVILGGRWERWQAFGGSISNAASTLPFAAREQGFFSPKLAASFQPTPALAVRASLGKAYRMPTVAELYQGSIRNDEIVKNDPNLKPEQALTGELTAEYDVGNGLLRATLFQENARDALYSQSNVSTKEATIQNIDRVRTRGVELAYQAVDVGIRGLDLSGSVTYADSIITQYDRFPTTVGKKQPRVPDWRATATVTYRQNEHLSWSTSARYSGKQFGTLDNTDINADTYGGVSSFFVVDVRVRYKMDKRWSAAIGVDNLTNKQYFVSHPFPLRTVSAELNYDF